MLFIYLFISVYCLASFSSLENMISWRVEVFVLLADKDLAPRTQSMYTE